MPVVEFKGCPYPVVRLQMPFTYNHGALSGPRSQAQWPLTGPEGRPVRGGPSRARKGTARPHSSPPGRRRTRPSHCPDSAPAPPPHLGSALRRARCPAPLPPLLSPPGPAPWPTRPPARSRASFGPRVRLARPARRLPPGGLPRRRTGSPPRPPLAAATTNPEEALSRPLPTRPPRPRPGWAAPRGASAGGPDYLGSCSPRAPGRAPPC
mmetsp:Transcript_16119/g.37361  ORF Transcript_16119/g.37361 Transcript_16119/m.37361 type:complete len:209 (-) Transcript_16119:682-1308(-)